MKHLLVQAYEYALYFFFPESCGACGTILERSSIVCNDCSDKISPITSYTLVITPSISMEVYAMCAYPSVVQKMILSKHWGDYITSLRLGNLLWERTTIPFLPIDCVVPIPLHWTRRIWRGYNQSEAIASVIANKYHVSVESCLVRSKRTVLQKKLSFAERELNLKAAFSVKDSERIRGKHILLVDDVMTSGATLRQAARELVRHKPASISAVVVARVV